MLNWDFAQHYSILAEADAMKVEAMVKIVEQLDKIASELGEIRVFFEEHRLGVDVTGRISTIQM